MTTTATPISAFDDIQWLHRFATGLARDPDDADDLVQDTLLEAWRAPPTEDGRSLRPWLASATPQLVHDARFLRAQG